MISIADDPGVLGTYHHDLLNPVAGEIGLALKLPVPTLLNMRVWPSQNSPFVGDDIVSVGVVTALTTKSGIERGEDDVHVAIVSLTL